MNALSELAKKHNTDKLLHGYTEFYSRYMDAVRNTTLTVVEFGIGKGASVRAWMEYFPNAHIYAIDNSDEAIATIWEAVKTGRVTAIKADQNDPTVWTMIAKPVDFVIDDGSHRPEHMIRTFEQGFMNVKPGGWWIIEDTQCTFHSQFSEDPYLLYPWFMEMVIEQQLFAINDDDFYAARDSNQHGRDVLAGFIYSYACYKNVIMFERAHD